MARYCEAKDLRALVPDMFRDAALADSSGGTEADAGLLKAVLDGACEEVDALIEGRVRLPLETVPAKLRVAAANIAMELLFIRRGRPLPEAAAEKVQWWRSWLSKVGEGELRLDAPDTAGKTEYPGAVATRPSITGSGRLLFALAVSFGIWAFGRAESLAVEARSWAFVLPESGDVFENPEEMEWSQGESLVLEYSGGHLEAGQAARWEVAGGTNLWIDAEPAGETPAWRWELSPEESAMPAGRYSGRVAVYSIDGGTTTFHRVAALQGIRVHAGVEGLATVAPLIVRLDDYALLSWVSNQLHLVAADIATNAEAIANLQEAAEDYAREDWVSGHFLPAERDEEAEEDAYVVEAGTTFQEPVTANGYRFGSGVVGPVLPTPSSSITNNILGRFASRGRAYANGIILNSAESFLRMTLGDFGGLVFRKEITSPKATATLKAGDVSVEGETITLKAEVYDEDEDETTPGTITLEGNTVTEGDIEAGSLTMDGVTWDAWPDLSGIEENAQGVASNSAAIGALEAWADSLYAECKGGWKWPDWFRVTDAVAGVPHGSVTNTAIATNTAYNIIEVLVTNTVLKGWQINTEIVRMARAGDAISWKPVNASKAQGDTIVPTIDANLLATSGNIVYFADGVEENDIQAEWAHVEGTLGGFSCIAELHYDPSRQSQHAVSAVFGGPAPGTPYAECWSNIIVGASNAYAQGKSNALRTWPAGYGSGTNHVPATWNTNFWGIGLGDFSCISYHTETPPGVAGGVYRPLTMVTPRHAVCANHWKPYVGSNVYWVSRSGGVVTNRVIAYTNIRGDLTVARLETAFDTNDILPAPLLESTFNKYLYGSTNRPTGMLGLPCITFDCAERSWVAGFWANGLFYGRSGNRGEQSSYKVNGAHLFGGGQYEGPYKGTSHPVGGDSGSPSFLCIQGTAILLGCYYTADGSGPMPNKEEVDEAISAWGDEERCSEWSFQGDGGWTSPDDPQPPR